MIRISGYVSCVITVAGAVLRPCQQTGVASHDDSPAAVRKVPNGLGQLRPRKNMEPKPHFPVVVSWVDGEIFNIVEHGFR